MQSLVDAFFSMESTAVISLLSRYSTSGLFKESQVDIDSSIETESPSDCVGDTSMLQGTGPAIAGRIASVNALLLQATMFGFIKEEAGRVAAEMPALLILLVGAPFLMLTILAVRGDFKMQNT